jgi:hypothetical protein
VSLACFNFSDGESLTLEDEYTAGLESSAFRTSR